MNAKLTKAFDEAKLTVLSYVQTMDDAGDMLETIIHVCGAEHPATKALDVARHQTDEEIDTILEKFRNAAGELSLLGVKTEAIHEKLDETLEALRTAKVLNSFNDD
jgi:hypothetical protein